MKNKLHQRFCNTMVDIGFQDLDFPTAVFYNAPVGIRFEIGGNQGVFLSLSNKKTINPIYLKNAFMRAKTLFDNLPYAPNILRIDLELPEIKDYSAITLDTLQEIGLSYPTEIVEEQKFDDGYQYIQQHLYWDLTQTSEPIDRLLLEIIKSGLGGFINLSSNVYFLNETHHLLFHLYDDRGADIVSKEKETLYPLYKQYNSWILEYDKENIMAIFETGFRF